MKLFSLIRSWICRRKHNKASRSTSLPSLTILMAINPTFQDKETCQKLLEDQAQKLRFLHPKTVLVDNIASYKDYNDFCKTRLVAAFDTDFVLIIQEDGKVLNPDAWSDDFFNYDYIGAPWKPSYGWWVKYTQKAGKDLGDKNLLVGNGGFSLRSRKFCQTLAKFPCSGYNEDTYACSVIRSKLEEDGVRFAPYEIAKKFSVEHDDYAGQLGAHKVVIIDGKKVAVNTL